MNFQMGAARAITVLDEVFRPFALRRARIDAARVWAEIQPALVLSGGPTPSNRMARFARNILAAGFSPPVRYLEIGAFEGSSLAFVHALLKGKVAATAIDPFANYGELPSVDMSSVEDRFTRNMRSIGAEVRTLRGTSIEFLPKLIAAGEKFDLIFIDGSHSSLDVMTDATLSWQLLAERGLLIFDDYRFRKRENGRVFECKPAIDAFVQMIGREVEIVDVAAQVFIRRRVVNM